MTVEYVVLGAILIVMGAVQIWLRHFAGRAEGEGQGRQVPSRRGVRSGRAWEGWTGILGFLALAMGVALVVLGVLGR
jgi:hypothetical protein